MVLISVVIPVFNGETTIAETIHSVLDQSFSDFELLVINDGSQDATLEVVEQILDPRLSIISYENAGLSASRNRGIHKASGEYISFLDADDIWTKDKLADQLKVLQANPNASIAYSWTDYIDSGGNFLQAGTHLSFNGNVLKQLLVINAIESGSNVLVKKAAFDQVGLFDETLKAAEDWDMWLRLAQDYEFVCTNQIHVLYRRINSMSANVVRQETECLKVIERAYKHAPQSVQHLKQHSLANLYKYLTFKALEGAPGRQKGFESARCLLNAIRNKPSLLKQSRVLISISAKILATVLLPPTQSEAFLNRNNS